MSLYWWFTGEGPCQIAVIVNFREQQEWSSTMRATGCVLTVSQHKQCPHQPGQSPAVSELDGLRQVKETRSQPQARQGDESSLELILVPVRSNRRHRRLSRRDSKWTSISENRTGPRYAYSTARARFGCLGLDQNGAPGPRGRESPDSMLSEQEGRRANFWWRTCAVKEVKEPRPQYIWFS